MISSLIRGFNIEQSINRDTIKKIIENLEKNEIFYSAAIKNLTSMVSDGTNTFFGTINNSKIFKLPNSDLVNPDPNYKIPNLLTAVDGYNSSPSYGHIRTLTYINGEFMVAGPSTSTNAVIYSKDGGTTWLTNLSVGNSSYSGTKQKHIVNIGNIYVKLANFDNTSYVTVNTSGTASGVWSNAFNIPGRLYWALRVIKNTFVIFGRGLLANNLYTSTDGMNWKVHTSPLFAMEGSGFSENINEINGKIVICDHYKRKFYSYNTIEDLISHIPCAVNNYSPIFSKAYPYNEIFPIMGGTEINVYGEKYLLFIYKSVIFITYDGETFYEFVGDYGKFESNEAGKNIYQIGNYLFSCDIYGISRLLLPKFSDLINGN